MHGIFLPEKKKEERNMRKELIFDRNSEDLSEYMTRAAEVFGL